MPGYILRWAKCNTVGTRKSLIQLYQYGCYIPGAHQWAGGTRGYMWQCRTKWGSCRPFLWLVLALGSNSSQERVFEAGTEAWKENGACQSKSTSMKCIPTVYSYVCQKWHASLSTQFCDRRYCTKVYTCIQRSEHEELDPSPLLTNWQNLMFLLLTVSGEKTGGTPSLLPKHAYLKEFGYFDHLNDLSYGTTP